MGAAAVALTAALALGAPAPVRVGSKEFTESEILGAMATQALAAGGVPAEHRRALGGTRILWEALLRGDLDVYPDYTGTISEEILGGAVRPDEEALRAALAPRGVGITRSLGFEDTYALAMRRDVADRLGVRRVSDLARLPALRIGFTSEFMDRKDGWPALRARYRLPQRDVRGLAHDLAYPALAAGEIDVTDVYSTDAEIGRYGLAVLEDDLHVFPEYRAVYVYRLDLEARAPAALPALRRLEGRIGASAMIDLNARVRIDGAAPDAAAAGFLRAALGLAPEVPPEYRWQRILARTREHLALVATALAGAILLGVPLGVLAARRPRIGRGVLALVGVVQTIPSLALLVFMIPLLGIGAGPAIAALFLYGLLPIVRNTHAGLTGIPPELTDSARAIGLPPAARLRLVELPLAAPAILAGVKTAAVIAVGTATLGALAGAGGYGQPILTGIRLASVPLILEGAIPAAALALLVQSGFDALEPLLVPRGLRRRAGRVES
ncbi:glycine betaine ABC transporter substrate-binding protein [Anaeromyxobacter oryzae]|uniref:glycine betaine ABC transporter substrate-binding protein n=1 Tax=Anaeromyxobacter oryzae TaxID=2918170 RepID=UPI0020BE8797|nr:glycine betaine ABC transporter substrate-binding protein [Anaeromyxobacter oryzae]